MKIAKLFVLAAALSACLYTQPRPNRVNTMVSLTRRIGPRQQEPLVVTPVPLRAAALPILARAVPAPSDAYPSAFANPAANSRYVPNLLQAPWKPNWQTPLPAGPAPRLLLWAGQRIVLQGGSAWRMFDAAGKAVAHGTYGAANLSLSEAHGSLFYINENAYVIGQSLSDGQPRFKDLIVIPQTFGHTRLALAGPRFFVHSVDQNMPHRPLSRRPTTSRLGSVEVAADFAKANSFALDIGTVSSSVAFDGDNVLLATPGLLHSFTADLQLTKSFSGDFEILQMSVDDLHRTHALVKLPSGRRAVWIITASGERQLEFAVPAEYGEIIAAPILGYDRRIYLVTKGLLAAFSPEGKLLWERSISGYSGGGIAPNGYFLASVGNRVVSFNPVGQELLLHEFKEETALTQPVITASGLILVAGAKNLYSLRQ